MTCSPKNGRDVQKCLNNNDVIGLVLTDLFKAYDFLHYGFLVAKLNAYGFGLSSLRMINNYFTSRKQRVKTGVSQLRPAIQ